MGHLIDIIKTGASIATVVGVFLTWRQITLVRKQATTTFEDRLTEQYRRIMEDIPTDIWLGSELRSLDLEHLEHRSRCRDAIYRYIDLSNEEAVLHNHKRVTDDAWIEWSKGIQSNMKLAAFVEVWKDVKIKSPRSFEELTALVAIPKFDRRGLSSPALGKTMSQSDEVSARA
jgi:hypothetical protein